MKDSKSSNSFSERIKKKAAGWNKRTVQRVSYTAIFVVVLSLVATSYISADSGTQVSLPGVSTGDNINVNLLQGQKIDQLNTANALATSASDSTGGQLASGSTTATAATPVATATTATTAGDVKSANVASSVASAVGLSSSNSVSSNAESANVSAQLAQADATSVSKQQIVEPTTESKALLSYTVKEGDNAETVATEYGVSSQTVRWANGLKDNNMTVGATITVPAVDGVVYTMKDGDTLDAVAGKYQSNVDEIVTINNLDTNQVATGAVILLPNGILPETERPEYVAPTPVRTTTRTSSSSSSRSSRSSLSVPAMSGNRYAYGYCTWYAFNRRVQLGLPVASGWGNANTWASSARAAGYWVDRTPTVGAIFQTGSGYYGHVGIVEEVYANGTIRVSEMNYAGWNVVSERTITNPGAYYYIH
ncbi:MAG: CHAP domain-containing protein [Candidatus Saccharibacteria bacterium]|nr:CHAP domain-containing protein [Candidatus Saccharibacteria bacterium]